MESKEEFYSRSIIDNILKDLLENSDLMEEDCGLCELYLDAELQLYGRAFPSLDMCKVEDTVREYLYAHNFLEYSYLIEGKVDFSVDEGSGAWYVSVSDELSDDLEVDETLAVDGWFVDISKKGLVKGFEFLDGDSFLGMVEDGEYVDWCVVRISVGSVVDCSVSFYIVCEGEKYGRLRQWFGKFVYDGDELYKGLRFIYK